nr:hypothetical protein [Rhodothermaceae bacterium]
QAYLDIEKIRFEERLQVSIETDRLVEETPVPPFIVHPLVENAIKHGVLGNEGALEVRIKIQKNQERLQITVANTGELGAGNDEETLHRNIPMNHSSHTLAGPHVGGVGLTNLKQRLHQLFGEKHQFNLYGKEGWVYAELEIG